MGSTETAPVSGSHVLWPESASAIKCSISRVPLSLKWKYQPITVSQQPPTWPSEEVDQAKDKCMGYHSLVNVGAHEFYVSCQVAAGFYMACPAVMRLPSHTSQKGGEEEGR